MALRRLSKMSICDSFAHAIYQSSVAWKAAWLRTLQTFWELFEGANFEIFTGRTRVSEPLISSSLQLGSATKNEEEKQKLFPKTIREVHQQNLPRRKFIGQGPVFCGVNCLAIIL